MTEQISLFANLKCIKSPVNPLPFRKTVLINNKINEEFVLNRKITKFRTADVTQIPYENLNEIWHMIEPNLEYVAHEAITKSVEYERELKSVLDYVFFWRPIPKFDNIFLPKKRIWPLFLRRLSDKDYQNTVRIKSLEVTKENVEKNTNQMMKKTVDDPQKKFMHTVRVLYRVSDDQIRILRKYNNPRNNIYVTDFETGDQKCVRTGKSSSLECLSYSEAEKINNIGGPITQSPKSYNDNGDLYYARQLADQLSALCSLRNLTHASFWAVTGTPTIRATLVGTSEDHNFEKSHFITVPEYEPGVSGRMCTDSRFSQNLYDEIISDKRRPIEIESAISKLSKKLIDHVKDAESLPHFGKKSLKQHQNFARNCLDMTYAQLKDFDREELEKEVQKISIRLKTYKKK